MADGDPKSHILQPVVLKAHMHEASVKNFQLTTSDDPDTARGDGLGRLERRELDCSGMYRARVHDFRLRVWI